MKVYKLNPVGFAANSYAVTEDGVNCVLIDCAQEGIKERVEKLKLRVRAILLTHGHYDHIGGCGEFFNDGVKIYCGEGEEKLIFSPANRAVFGDKALAEFKIAAPLRDGHKVRVGGLEIKVISTPGHTSGGVCYQAGDAIFTGDTLFFGSIGRTDLPTGDYNALVKSIKKLYALKGNYRLYCGHGEDSSLDLERISNPYVKDGR